MADTRCFIDGELVDTADSYDNIDPSSGSVIGSVARGGEAEIDRAVAAARSANRAWRKVSPEDRARLLTRFADVIADAREELALLESEDTGKPLSQARTDADVCARYFRFYGHAIDSYYGTSIPLRSDLHVYTRREPFGVTGHIVAWNYPMQLLARGIAPAIATGNCAVLKPADETPRAAVRLAQLAVGAGIPSGVFNVVTGIGIEAGAALTAHPGVDHVGFVGSTVIGSAVATAAAARVAPVTLELGGKSAHLVFPDADLERASTVIARAILQNAGQTCSAGSRVLAHASIHDDLVARVAARFAQVSIAAGRVDPDLGPLVSRKQQDRVMGYVNSVDRSQIVTGGFVPDIEGGSNGAFFAPTLIANVDPMAPIAQEEVFGPVIVTASFTSEDEAIALANCTEYALLGAVWTTDISRGHRLAAEIEAGQVYINTYGAGGGVELPFGGFKKSGYGREKGYDALDSFTQTKTVIVQL
ncbi:MAG: aldehyde dehydrogenase family protein [Acidimicrobiia bacterium]